MDGLVVRLRLVTACAVSGLKPLGVACARLLISAELRGGGRFPQSFVRWRAESSLDRCGLSDILR